MDAAVDRGVLDKDIANIHCLEILSFCALMDKISSYDTNVALEL